MKVVILAGGFGTRLSEYTNVIPKPMVPIGGKPILWHIMQFYAKYGHKDFYVALGYRSEVIKDYFLNYRELNSDFTLDLNSGDIEHHEVNSEDWKVTLIDTGDKTMTGGRLKRVKDFVMNETFCFTYGDTLNDLNISKLIQFHKSNKALTTLTACHPIEKYGILKLKNSKVVKFQEKPFRDDMWVNGGYFVVNPEFFELIDGDDILLEREPLEKAVAMGELMAFKHHGFWQCMDTKRDHELLEELWVSGQCPWTNL